ncbi:hypothetical protein QL285_044265 [Trifolium repens]|nr:hypothetical protein QL285_044265 [Trifolium repens]
MHPTLLELQLPRFLMYPLCALHKLSRNDHGCHGCIYQRNMHYHLHNKQYRCCTLGFRCVVLTRRGLRLYGCCSWCCYSSFERAANLVKYL